MDITSLIEKLSGERVGCDILVGAPISFFGMNNLDVYANGFENEFTTTACIKQTTTDIIKNLNNIVEACYHLPGEMCRLEVGVDGLLTRGSM